MVFMCLDYLSRNPETFSNKNMAGNRAISESLWLCGFNEYSSLISLLHTTDEYILPETLADYVNVPQFFQLPTSPPRTGSGIYSPLATSMMDERKWGNIKNFLTCVVRAN